MKKSLWYLGTLLIISALVPMYLNLEYGPMPSHAHITFGYLALCMLSGLFMTQMFVVYPGDIYAWSDTERLIILMGAAAWLFRLGNPDALMQIFGWVMFSVGLVIRWMLASRTTYTS
jgi:hypothetical protein